MQTISIVFWDFEVLDGKISKKKMTFSEFFVVNI